MVKASHCREMGRINRPGTDYIILSKGDGLVPLFGVSRLRGPEDVGRGKEGWQLIAVDEIPAIQVVLCVDGVINPGVKLVI